MHTIMDLCFLCIKEYNCVMADDRIVSQVEYLLPEITIVKLGIPLRICSVCDGALCAFNKFKQSSVESSRRLEARIKGAQGPPLLTDSPSVLDDSEPSVAKPEKMEEILIKEEYVEQTPLDTQMHSNRAFLDPIVALETISAEPNNQLHKDRVSQNIQLHTDTNADNIEEIFIKEEQIEETPQGSEFYNIVKEEYMSNSMTNYTDTQPEHTEEESATLNSNEEVWEGSSPDSEEETLDETDGDWSKNMQTKLFSCSECNKTFKYKSNLNQHLKIHFGAETFQCEICSKSLISKSNLFRHMKIHSGVKDAQCKICGKVFTQKTHLTYHMKIHAGVKDFQCEICDKPFTRNCDLLRHMKIHSGVKEFRCDICGKLFTEKSNLTSHMRIHFEERKFQCEICSKSFKFKNSLNYHMKLHSGIKDFQCKICAKSFTLKGTLISHMKSHSGLEEVL